MGTIKESIIINGILPITDIVFRTNISKWYHNVRRMLHWSPEQIKDWQTERLHELINIAYNHSVYYREVFDSLGLKPEDIRTVDDLVKLPPLTKDIIRERFDDIKLTNIDEYSYKYCSTGGSTGNPTKYIKDNLSWGFDNAFNIHMWRQTGYHYGDKFLAMGSSSLFPVNKRSRLHEWYYRLKGKIPFNAMNLSLDRLKECVGIIKKNDIHYINGYASSIFLLAKYVKENNLGSELNIKACFPTSEILTETYRKTISEAFNCQISDAYGAHDGGIVAHNLTGGFKVSYNCLVETKPSPTGCGGAGAALLTDVLNYSFPFIRYELGDELELGEGYGAFYNGQVLSKVIGRTSDVIELENGRVLTGPGFTILFSKLNVTGYRLYKSGPMEISVEVVRSADYSEADDALIEGTVKKHAGDDCKVVIAYATAVKQRENGKNMYFLNDK